MVRAVSASDLQGPQDPAGQRESDQRRNDNRDELSDGLCLDGSRDLTPLVGGKVGRDEQSFTCSHRERKSNVTSLTSG